LIYSLEIYLKSIKQLCQKCTQSKSGDAALGLETPIALCSLLLSPLSSKFCENWMAVCRGILCLDVVVLLQDTLLMLRLVWVGLSELDHGRRVGCKQ